MGDSGLKGVSHGKALENFHPIARTEAKLVAYAESMPSMGKDHAQAAAGAKGSAAAHHEFPTFTVGAVSAVVGGLGMNAGLGYLNGYRNTVGRALFDAAVDRGNPVAMAALRRANTITAVAAILTVGGAIAMVASQLHKK